MRIQYSNIKYLSHYNCSVFLHAIYIGNHLANEVSNDLYDNVWAPIYFVVALKNEVKVPEDSPQIGDKGKTSKLCSLVVHSSRFTPCTN